MAGVLLLFLLSSVFIALMAISIAFVTIKGVGVDFPFVAIGGGLVGVILLAALAAGAFWASRIFHWYKRAS